MKIPKFVADHIRALLQEALEEATRRLLKEIGQLIDEKLGGKGV